MSPGVNVLDANLLMVQFVEIISKMFPDSLTLDVHCCCDQACFRGPRLREQLYLSWDLNSLQMSYLSHLLPHASSNQLNVSSPLNVFTVHFNTV